MNSRAVGVEVGGAVDSGYRGPYSYQLAPAPITADDDCGVRVTVTSR